MIEGTYKYTDVKISIRYNFDIMIVIIGKNYVIIIKVVKDIVINKN